MFQDRDKNKLCDTELQKSGQFSGLCQLFSALRIVPVSSNSKQSLQLHREALTLQRQKEQSMGSGLRSSSGQASNAVI